VRWDSKVGTAARNALVTNAIHLLKLESMSLYNAADRPISPNSPTQSEGDTSLSILSLSGMVKVGKAVADI